MNAPGSAPDARPARRRRASPRVLLGIGLVLTLIGLFVLGGSVPTQSSTLERDVAITGIGAVALWVGGVLLGRGSHP